MDADTAPDLLVVTIDAPEGGDDDTVVDDVLVEEISIDGMCGVY